MKKNVFVFCFLSIVGFVNAGSALATEKIILDKNASVTDVPTIVFSEKYIAPESAYNLDTELEKLKEIEKSFNIKIQSEIKKLEKTRVSFIFVKENPCSRAEVRSKQQYGSYEKLESITLTCTFSFLP